MLETGDRDAEALKYAQRVRQVHLKPVPPDFPKLHYYFFRRILKRLELEILDARISHAAV